MFFYTLLFVASVIMALIVLYLYNALVSVGRAVYRAILPSSKDNRTSHRKDLRFSTSINDTLTPWGWESRPSLAPIAPPRPAVSLTITPWGWKGNGAEIRARGASSQTAAPGFDTFLKNNNSGFMSEAMQKPATGWPYREEKFEFAGKAYKVTRRTIPNNTDLQAMATPWGW